MRRLLFVVPLLLAGCGSTILGVSIPPTPRNPDQALFEAHTVYVAALKLTTAYGDLGICHYPAVQPCADPNVVIMANTLSRGTDAALKAASPIVVAWTVATSNASLRAKADAAVAAAVQTLASLKQFAATLGGK